MPKQIMLIDDDEVFHKVVGRCCRDLPDHELAVSAFDGAEGLAKIEALLQRGENPPDVVFVDVNMPVMDGFGFLSGFSELRKRYECLETVKPVAMLTSSDQDKDKEKAKELGADTYLVKGAGLDEVRESILSCVQ
jgi:CheY-like chemotaxis protein